MSEVTVIALQGELDLHSSPMVKEQLQPAIDARCPSIVVDLSDVTYVDSSGLAVFIEAMQRVTAYDGSFALCGLRENVKHIFSIARLDQIFRIYPDRESAGGEK